MIGVISDTHGLVRPEVLPVFAGAALIIHAGDIGTSEVLKELRSIAPVIAVRGNNDKDAWASAIPETKVIQFGNVSIYVLHDLKEIDLSPGAAGYQVVVSGHSHRPLIDRREGVLYVNPGSAGPRRFKLPITVARLTIEGTKVEGEVVNLSF
ncbi:MAG: YfcE family phosphodiesterase [Acidobacteria bacterium]|nr:MAG: YfcE family phosphodiesterase [Acidobacteriota bacterium]